MSIFSKIFKLLPKNEKQLEELQMECKLLRLKIQEDRLQIERLHLACRTLDENFTKLVDALRER